MSRRPTHHHLIVIIHTLATSEQMEQMLLEHKFYIKVAVDIERY